MPVDFIEGFDRYPTVAGGIGVRGKWIFSQNGSLVAGRVGGQAYEPGGGITLTKNRRPITPTLQHSSFFAFKHSVYTGTSVDPIFELRNSTGVSVVGINYDLNDNIIVYLRGVIVATIPFKGLPNVWKGYSVVWEGHASLGILQVRINGELLVDMTNVNTQFTSGAQLASEICCNCNPTSGVGGQTTFDDIRVDYDTIVPIPEGRVAPKFPDSDISVTWTPLSGPTNALMIDEVTCDSDVTYISSLVEGNIDEYGFGVLGFSPDKIHAVQVTYGARKDDAATRVIGCNLKLGAASSPMNPGFLSTDYEWFEKVFVPADLGETEFDLAMLNSMTVAIEDLGDGA